MQTFGEVVQPSLNVGAMQMGNGILGSLTGSSSVSNYQLFGSTTPAQLTNFFVYANPTYYNDGNTKATSFRYGGPGIFGGGGDQ